MTKRIVFILAAILVFAAAAPCLAAGDYAKVINKDKPGMVIDIEKYVVKGKICIFDFYSEYCGPCIRLAPKLEELDRKRDDIVVMKLDINRAGVSGIDWGSPLAKAYKIQSVPNFFIYGTDGKATHSGQGASEKVMEYLKTTGIR
jgi:thioredoxin 1